MKSKLKCDKGSTPDVVITTCESIISEWEEFTGDSAEFDIFPDSIGFIVTHIGQAKGVYRPFFKVTPSGCIYKFKAEDNHAYHGVKFLFTYKVNHCWYSTEDSHDTAASLSLSLGVDDILNLKPHEYGYLKLKYALPKELLFIPTIVKEQLLKG